MKVPTWFLTIVLGVVIGTGAWMAQSLIDIRERIVRIETIMKRNE